MEAIKILIIYWPEKGHDTIRINQKLSMRLSHTLLAYSTITDWLRKRERGDDITRHAPGSGRLPDDHINTLITSALEQSPFHSLRTLRSSIKHPRIPVWRHLHSAGFVVRNLPLGPHELSFSQKAERVGMVIELQQVLQSAKHRA
jgi:hypothetical protein